MPQRVENDWMIKCVQDTEEGDRTPLLDMLHINRPTDVVTTRDVTWTKPLTERGSEQAGMLRGNSFFLTF